jgi:hypothetical protein
MRGATPRRPPDEVRPTAHLGRRRPQRGWIGPALPAEVVAILLARASACCVRTLCVVAKVCNTYLRAPVKTRFFLALERKLRLGRSISRVDRYGRLLVGKENPVAVLFWQFSPRLVDIVAKGHQNIPQVLALPGSRPGGNRSFTNCLLVVGHKTTLANLMNATDAMAIWTGALRRIRRKGLRIEHRLVAWIVAGARVQHPQQVRQRGDAADR